MNEELKKHLGIIDTDIPLLNCPFCGSSKIDVISRDNVTKCMCSQCFSNGTDFDNREWVYRGKEATQRAIEAWNKRA